MLNGKFYTGLPPKMMLERSGGGVPNRQESHFFWPDDTKTESAVETRVRRRNSLDTTTIKPTKMFEKPQQTYATLPENEVDTRQMFKKEFANSSIQFFDNLQDEPAKKGRTASRKQELTPKLTATKLELPKEQTVNEAYTTAKRKQAYSSKIEFYDYVNEEEPTPNNTRKPKMDMNDKREVERNTKNSPKLQVKRNVRNFSVDRELYAPVKQEQKSVKPQRPHLELNLSKQQNINTTDIYDLDRSKHHFEQQQQQCRAPEPKKILKNATAPSYPNENYNDYRVAADYLDAGLRQLRLHSSVVPKKHVTYSDEAYEQEYYDTRRPPLLRPLRQIRTFYDDSDDLNNVISAYDGESLSRPNMRTGNGNRQQQRQQLEQLEPQIRQYMETGSELKTINKNNNNNNDNSNRSNNYGNNMASNNNKNVNSQTLTSQIKSEKSSHAASPLEKYSRATSAEPPTSPLSPTDPLKHLRSSLCFNGDALIVASVETPTNETPRRKARSSAGSQRISVGLPD